MTREKVIEVLDLFLHKQCDLARVIPSYDYNTIWHAVDFARESLGTDNGDKFVCICDSCGRKLNADDKRYIVTIGDDIFDLCNNCVKGYERNDRSDN